MPSRPIPFCMLCFRRCLMTHRSIMKSRPRHCRPICRHHRGRVYQRSQLKNRTPSYSMCGMLFSATNSSIQSDTRLPLSIRCVLCMKCNQLVSKDLCFALCPVRNCCSFSLLMFLYIFHLDHPSSIRHLSLPITTNTRHTT